MLEVAVLNIIPGKEAEFEAAFRAASAIISNMAGYVWKKLLHHFYNPFPTVEHYELVLEQKA